MTTSVPPDGPVAVLIGPMGVGKSTVGRLLADLLAVSFLDVDDVIVGQEGRSIADIFVDDGEAYFREIERAVTLRLLGEHTGVLALGGGAPMQDEVAANLSGRPVVFLDVGIADAARRIGFDTSRPLLAVNPRASWVSMMNDRRETYERLGRWRVDTAGRDATAVARDVAAMITSAGPA